MFIGNKVLFSLNIKNFTKDKYVSIHFLIIQYQFYFKYFSVNKYILNMSTTKAYFLYNVVIYFIGRSY